MKIDDLQCRLEAEFQKIKQVIQRPNILLAGATGAGKSSLVNLCFGTELATVGVGVPVTQTIQSYSSPDVSVVLFDSKGYEIGSPGERQFLDDVIGLASNLNQSLGKQIHLVWYCVQAPSSRITDFDIHAIKNMTSAGLPVAIVLTKSDLVGGEDAEGLKTAIQEALPGMAVFETSTRSELGLFDLNKLVAWSSANLSESLRFGFISSQRRNIDLKREEAKSILLQHSGGSAFVGFSPIPGSDAPILIANQTAMLARILYAFDLQKMLGGLPVMTVIGPLLRELGMFLVGNLLKFFPGIGTVAGGMINGTIAGSLTYAFGMAVIELCVRIYEEALNGSGDKLKELIDNASAILNEEVVNELRRGR